MNNIKQTISLALALALLLSGCAPSGGAVSSASNEDAPYIDRITLDELVIEDEAVALADAPAAVGNQLLPEASGTAVKREGNAVIDYSNIADGYVMVQYGADSAKKMKVQVAGPSTTYTYDLPASDWVTFPLSDGSGSYKVTALENTQGSKYAVLVSASFQAALTDEFAPFIRPNQYVNYANAENTVRKAEQLAGQEEDSLKKVEKIYGFVVNHLSYDAEKAAAVKSGYLPVLDDVLEAKQGICFDYASLMAGMLRSQGVPCKLVVGYAGTNYHAWISVWTEEAGWLDGVIFFDGAAWQRMDPTFASSGKGSEAVMKYIGDGTNYTAKYLY